MEILMFILMILTAIVLGMVFKKFKLPSLLGYLIAGLIFKDVSLPYPGLIRNFALLVIMVRAGLSMDLDQLKNQGISSLLMSFVPALFEISGAMILGPIFFNITVQDSLLLGTVLAAVSPAIVVPRMIKLKEEGYKKAPEIVMAGSSLDDIFILVLFASLITKQDIPLPLILASNLLGGLAIGLVSGFILRKLNLKSWVLSVVLLMAMGGLFIYLETFLTISAMLAIIVMSAIYSHGKELPKVETTFKNFWIPMEMLLFILVGLSVDLNSLTSLGIGAGLFILAILVFRMSGVLLALAPSDLKIKEKTFACFAYIPKATVQAAIGTIPLAMGINQGALILSVSALAILITAPLGAILIDFTYKKLLNKEAQN